MTLRRLLLALGLAALLSGGYAAAAGVSIALTASGPTPVVATVAWGDTVTFTNADNKMHQLLIPRLNLQTAEIGPGGTFVHVFDGRRGNYGYRQTGGGPNKLATIVVDLKGSVTLNASAPTIRWGSTLRLTGKSSFPGTPVNLAERVPGSGTPWRKIQDGKAASDGTFTFELKPQRGVQYRAQVAADQLTSPTLRVSVQPVLTISTSVRRTTVGKMVTVTARVAPVHAASALDLQALDAGRIRWQLESRKPTRNGVATFRWKAQKGATRLRIGVQPLALRNGWAESVSRSVTVTGVR